jgi:opacity protein-like surface antigen
MQKTLLGIVTSAALFCSASFASGGLVQPMPVAPAHPAGWIIGLDGGYSEINSMDSDLLPNFRPHALSAFDDHIVYTPNYNQDHDMGDFMWGLHLGRDFNVTDNFLMGVEVGYKDFGKNTYDENFNPTLDAVIHDRNRIPETDSRYGLNQGWSVDIKQQAIDFLLTGKYYMWEGLNANAKAGLAYVKSKTNSNFSASVYQDDHLNQTLYTNKGISNNWEESEWRLEPEFALGLGYSFTPNIDATIWYDYIHGTDGNEQNNVSGENFGIQNESAHSYSINSVLLSLGYKFTT